MTTDAPPASPETSGFKRWLAVLVGAVAITAALLAWMESEAARGEDVAKVDATRASIDVFVKLGASGPRYQFEIDSVRRTAVLTARAEARITANVATLLALQVQLDESLADNATAGRLLELAERLQDLPEEAPGLDEAASDSIRIRSEEDVEPLYESREEAQDRAAKYGGRQERAMYGLLLVAIGASLVGLAGLIGAGRSGNIALGAAGVTLLVALATGASGLLT